MARKQTENTRHGRPPEPGLDDLNDLNTIDDSLRGDPAAGDIHDYAGANPTPMRGEDDTSDASGDTDSTEEGREPAESGSVPTSFSGDGGALEDDSRGLDE